MTAVQEPSRTYRRLLGQIRPYRRIFTGALVSMVLLATTEAGIPAILKPVLDGTFVEQDPLYLKWAPLAMVCLFFFRGLFGFLSTAGLTAVSTRVVYDLRECMFDALLTLPNSRFDQEASGNLISKLTYDVNQFTSTAAQVVTVLVRDSVSVVALLAYVFWLDWQLSLFVFILLPVVAGVAWVIGGRLRRLSRTLQDGFGQITHVLEELTRGHKVVKIFHGEAQERRRFLQVAKLLRQYQFKVQTTAASGVPVVEFFGAVVMASAIYIGINRGQEDPLSIGAFVAFFTALGLLFSPIKRLTKVNEPLQRALAAAESIYALVDEPPEQDVGSRPMARAEGQLEFEAVVFRYQGAERDALQDLSFRLAPGRMLALVGASGSGKTTAASLLPRLYEIDGGRILLDGVDIRDLPLADLRRQIAYVGQDVTLFNDTVAANIAYGCDEIDIGRAREAAQAAQALEFIEALPEGFDSEIGESGVRLSGGQRQRLAIARALYKDAPILILDEATSALDSASERKVQQALENLEKDRTTLVIAHRLSTVEKADRILVLNQGRLAESGSHQELLAGNGLYASLYRTQFQQDD